MILLQACPGLYALRLYFSNLQCECMSLCIYPVVLYMQARSHPVVLYMQARSSLR